MIDGKEPTGVLGDVDDSGVVDQADVELMEQYIEASQSGTPLPQIDELNSDIDENGTINNQDLALLREMVPSTTDAKVKFKVMKDDDFKQQQTFDTHTVTITNENGIISDSFDEEQSASLYVGATKLTDIVVMNDIPGLTQFLAVENNILVGVPNNFSTALGNPNKLYVWYNSDSWYIFVYNPKNHTYMQLGASVRTDGSSQVNDSNSQLNYVSSKADVSDPSKYTSKTWVYYPQSSS